MVLAARCFRHPDIGAVEALDFYPAPLPNVILTVPYNQSVTVINSEIVPLHLQSRRPAAEWADVLKRRSLFRGNDTVRHFSYSYYSTIQQWLRWQSRLHAGGSCSHLYQPAHPAGRHAKRFYSQTLTASGGIAPHSITGFTGTLPPGLTLVQATECFQARRPQRAPSTSR